MISSRNPEHLKREGPVAPRGDGCLVPAIFVLAAAARPWDSESATASARAPQAGEELARATNQAATPVVKVTHPTLAAPMQEDRSARKHAGIHRFADLRAHQRLSDALVFRYRRAGEEGRSAGGDRNAGNRSAAAAGAGAARDSAGQLRAGENHCRPLAVAAEEQLGFEAGNRSGCRESWPRKKPSSIRMPPMYADLSNCSRSKKCTRRSTE